jgi:hypothetical protein
MVGALMYNKQIIYKQIKQQMSNGKNIDVWFSKWKQH